MSYKVFTNGSVLNASEINEFLMNQSVISFSSSTARAAAIPAPIEGMLTWLEDVNRYEFRNGSGAWVELIPSSTPSGLTLLNTTTFSTVSSQSINNVFSSTYETYKIVLSLTASANTGLRLRMRASGADETGANYSRQFVIIEGTGTSVNAGRAASQTGFEISDINGKNTGQVEVYNPNNAEPTTFSAMFNKNAAANGGQAWFSTVGNHTLSTAYTGFTIFPITGTITGTVSTYGLAK